MLKNKLFVDGSFNPAEALVAEGDFLCGEVGVNAFGDVFYQVFLVGIDEVLR